MKFLIIQENGRHDKNRNFRECFCLQRSLISINHECVVWGLNHSAEVNDFNKFDVIINLENYDNGWVPDLSKYTTQYKILWSIDSHFKGIKSYLNEFNRGKYNLILQATKDFVNKNSIWFPNCFDHTLIYPKDIPKKCDVGFCGNLLNRKSYIRFLQDKFNFVSDIFVIGDDMVNAINSYKIHFNRNIANDINYRNFETIGCKVCLITNTNHQYDDLGFVDLKNCLFYNNMEQLEEKIKNVLSNNELLNSISNGGYELSKFHTYDVRAKYLIEILESKIK